MTGHPWALVNVYPPASAYQAHSGGDGAGWSRPFRPLPGPVPFPVRARGPLHGGSGAACCGSPSSPPHSEWALDDSNF